jgi:hypothetical protein
MQSYCGQTPHTILSRNTQYMMAFDSQVHPLRERLERPRQLKARNRRPTSKVCDLHASSSNQLVLLSRRFGASQVLRGQTDEHGGSKIEAMTMVRAGGLAGWSCEVSLPRRRWLGTGASRGASCWVRHGRVRSGGICSLPSCCIWGDRCLPMLAAVLAAVLMSRNRRLVLGWC